MSCGGWEKWAGSFFCGSQISTVIRPPEDLSLAEWTCSCTAHISNFTMKSWSYDSPATRWIHAKTREQSRAAEGPQRNPQRTFIRSWALYIWEGILRSKVNYSSEWCPHTWQLGGGRCSITLLAVIANWWYWSFSANTFEAWTALRISCRTEGSHDRPWVADYVFWDWKWESFLSRGPRPLLLRCSRSLLGSAMRAHFGSGRLSSLHVIGNRRRAS